MWTRSLILTLTSGKLVSVPESLPGFSSRKDVLKMECAEDCRDPSDGPGHGGELEGPSLGDGASVG
jgi:hypothetical protein